MPSTVVELRTFEVRQQRVLRRSVVAGPSTSESGLKPVQQRIAAGLDRWRRKPSVWQERLGLCCCWQGQHILKGN